MARHIRDALQMQKRRETTLTGRKRNDGQALVEFAWVLPLLMLVMVAILKFGIFFYNYITLCNAVNTAARTLSVNRGAGTGPPTACSLAVTALDSAAKNLNISQITTDLTCSSNCTALFPSPDTSTCSALVSGDSAVVTATYPCSLVIFGYNVIPNCTLSSQTTIRIE